MAGPVAGDDSRAFATIRPGLLYDLASPRLVLEGTAQAELVEDLLGNERTPSVLGRVGWRANWLSGPRSTLAFGMNADKGLTNLLASRTTSDQTDAGLMPVGAVAIWHADAEQAFTYEWSRFTRIAQGATARYSSTDDGRGTLTDTREADLTLGLEHERGRDTFGLTGAAAFLRLQRLTPPGSTLGSAQNDQLDPRATASWRHDLDARWSTVLDGGAVWTIPVGLDAFQPMAQRHGGRFTIGGGQLAYTELWGTASLSVRRDMVANPFVSQNTIGDAVRLRAALPLPWLGTRKEPELAMAASLGYERTQIVDAESGTAQGDFRAGRLDLSFGWTPNRIVTYGLRYELIRQTGDTAIASIPTYLSNTLYFTFALTYPRRTDMVMPKRGTPLRSDRSDLQPVVVEPIE